MTKFKDNNGTVFEAANAKDLVKQMAAESFGSTEESLRDYMQAVASRAEVAASVTLRYDNVDSFVADMLIHGLLTTETEGATP